MFYIYTYTVLFRKYPGCIKEGAGCMQTTLHMVNIAGIWLDRTRRHMQNSQAWPAFSTPSFMHPGYFANGTVYTLICSRQQPLLLTQDISITV